ncbi:MAG: hypothetical protein K9M36_02065 [Candidatus Pacebacteria bacterium]|nr:hypothetical protein [Candidatus Paceibacterota bacterium]
MHKKMKDGLAAMEKPGGLKDFTVKELWILMTQLQGAGKATPESMDRISENIYLRIKDTFEEEREIKLTFPEILGLIVDYPDHLQTTSTLSKEMDKLECSLFMLAFELATTTEQFLDLLFEATEMGQSTTFCELCKDKALSVAVTAKDYSMLKKAGLSVEA